MPHSFSTRRYCILQRVHNCGSRSSTPAPALGGELTGWCAGPNTGLGLENMKHVISIHDVVSDTMHQFAPTYHNYVLYSNQGSKEAPKTVSPSPQQHK